MTAQGKMMAKLPPPAYAGLKPTQKPRSQANWNQKIAELGVFRDQLSLAHWLLAGATLHALLILVLPPLPKTIIVLPVLVLATWKVLQAIVAISSYRPGKAGDHVILGKFGATMEKDIKSDGGVCLLISGARSNQLSCTWQFVFITAQWNVRIDYCRTDIDL
jgi:hypothetical protein